MSAEKEQILEINLAPLIAESDHQSVAYINATLIFQPEQTLFAKLRATLQQAFRLLNAARNPRHRLVVCRSFGRFVYRRELSLAVNILRRGMGLFIRFCLWLRVVRGGAKLIVIDWLDENVLSHRDLFLLDHCETYYKCQLPQNHWGVFRLVEPQHQSPGLLAQNPKFLSRVRKLRPLPLGISKAKITEIERALAQAPGAEKSIDLFFAGHTYASTVRTDGIRQLRQLAERGWRVEIHDQQLLPFPEFVRRMAAAWLVWSPEGLGWDCYRHAEICMAGSVPLMNHAQNHRHRPLIDGEHAVYYAIEGDDLTRKVEAALADKPRLAAMAQAARAHVLSWHTHAKIADYIVAQAGAAELPSFEREA